MNTRMNIFKILVLPFVDFVTALAMSSKNLSVNPTIISLIEYDRSCCFPNDLPHIFSYPFKMEWSHRPFLNDEAATVPAFFPANKE